MNVCIAKSFQGVINLTMYPSAVNNPDETTKSRDRISKLMLIRVLLVCFWGGLATPDRAFGIKWSFISLAFAAKNYYVAFFIKSFEVNL